MEAVAPGESRPVTLTNLPAGLVGTIGVRLEDSADNVVQSRSTEGISEFAAGSYRKWITFPEARGIYVLIADAEGVEAIEEFRVTSNAGASVEVGSLYATAADLRAKLKVSSDVLPDEEALEILETACDLIDDRLGVRPVDPETGRKVVPADEEGWRVQKLAKATLEVAKVLFEDPGVESRQRQRSISGDVATSSPYGPAYGERADALLSQSGLRVNRARMSGSARRGPLGRFK